jgi:hypothetical protein
VCVAPDIGRGLVAVDDSLEVGIREIDLEGRRSVA